MRFGLVGTGHWARTVHGRTLAEASEVELAGVWGRDAGKVEAAAAELGTRPYLDLAAMLDDVEALAFAVPPDVQAPIALGAARAGKHLLLEKPVATSTDAADELERAVAEAGVASVVFFTLRFLPDIRRWLGEVAPLTWDGAMGHVVGAAFAPGSPFDTPWRHEKGGLWDVGPHALSVLVPALGPVRRVAAAVRGRDDLVQLVLEHESGATAALALSISASPEAAGSELVLWGAGGRSSLPAGPGDDRAASRLALAELLASATSRPPSHPCDVAFGATVVHVLAEAETLIVR